MYVLLSDMEKEVDSVRRQFRWTAVAHTDRGMGQSVLEAITDLYPFDYAIQEGGNCQGRAAACINANDRNVLRSVLRTLGSNPGICDVSKLGESCAGFFSRAPDPLFPVFVQVAREFPEEPAIADLLVERAKGLDPEALPRAIEEMAALATAPSSAALRQTGFRAIAAADPYATPQAEQWHEIRSRAAGQLLARPEVRNAIESNLAKAGGVTQAYDSLAPATQAVLALLRTQYRAESDDWTDVVGAHMASSGEIDRLGLFLWMKRVHMDAAGTDSDPWGADVVLDAFRSRQAAQPEDAVLAEAVASVVPLAGAGQIAEYAAALTQVLESSPGDGRHEDMLQALIDREKTGQEGFPWLTTVLGDTGRASKTLRDMVLARMDGPAGDGTFSFAVPARYARKALRGDETGREGAEIVMQELLRRLDQGGKCAVAAAVEDSGLAAALLEAPGAGMPAVQELRRALPWIGAEITGTDAIRIVAGLNETLDVPPDIAEGDGGFWRRLDVDERALVKMAAPAFTEVVFMDARRTHALVRNGPEGGESFPVVLEPGSYAMGLRRCGATASPKVSGGGEGEARAAEAPKLALTVVEPTPAGSMLEVKPVSVSSREAPHVVLRSTIYEFDAGDQTGEIWFHLDVDRGDVLIVETQPIEGDPELDTAIELYDAADTLLDENDDFGDSLFSRIRYQATGEGPVMLRIKQYEPAEFDQGTRLRIALHVFRAPGTGQRESAGEAQSLGPSSCGEPVRVDGPATYEFAPGGPGEEACLKIAVGPGDTLDVETRPFANLDNNSVDTFIEHVAADTTDKIIDEDDDSNGLFSRYYYSPMEREEVLIRIRGIDDEHFTSDTRFYIDVRLVTPQAWVGELVSLAVSGDGAVRLPLQSSRDAVVQLVAAGGVVEEVRNADGSEAPRFCDPAVPGGHLYALRAYDRYSVDVKAVAGAEHIDFLATEMRVDDPGAREFDWLDLAKAPIIADFSAGGDPLRLRGRADETVNILFDLKDTDAVIAPPTVERELLGGVSPEVHLVPQANGLLMGTFTPTDTSFYRVSMPEVEAGDRLTAIVGLEQCP